jgi:hypothetical protein
MVVGCGAACGGAGGIFAGAVDAGPVCAVPGCAWSGVGAGADICTVAGCDVGCESAGCCATALSETSKVAETIQFKVRITLISMILQKPISSVRQLENNVYDRGGIHRLTIA